ncbi:TolC family protein [Pseudidiomarina terrestris]|uniref:TolC family protein n=1 Tax=Pseudidiomarina terrestris TaxID=2820060 RepID=A0AAW7R2I4_9GAMM|nr:MULTISPECIES: TolC family protein [unclassified Pseudidiomarina]MDN7125499.1 TolC family protein [Pseudidiomarina sp. 1APP75-32.1]MDN7128070.1 TolC family protein [Pseudidiomarina sp. 1APR75-33.1]MDN7130257.1 TolC family protein [Pseudidiomarina sp. 1APR75-15]MDN7135766.1 TolC family protein [Pseudidiomarina sp. 1ASP75-5]MDN7137197.1 TolC family protein [Pseudidiomarina sp. 1ASP75-14]
MKLLYFVVAAVVGSVVLPASAIANDLTLGNALERVLQNNPVLQKYPYQQRMAEAEKLQASLTPNPKIGLELENFAGSGTNRGFENAQATLSLSQLIELGGKREQRIELASVKQRQLNAEFDYSKLAVFAETAHRFYQLIRLQVLADWSQQQKLRLDEALRVALERVEAGAVPPSEVTRIRLQQQQVIAKTEEITGQIQVAKSNLSAMWASAPDFTQVTGKFSSSLRLPTDVEVEEAVNQAPEFLRLVDSEHLLAARVSTLKAEAIADVTLGVGVRYDNQLNDSGLVVQASMPLQLTNPNLGFIQAKQAERDLILDQQRVVRQQLRADARTLLARLQANRNYLERIRLDLLPIARQLEQETKAGYAKGIHSLLMVLDAQEELAQLEYQQINRRYAIYQDLLELERMTGQSFLGPEL